MKILLFEDDKCGSCRKWKPVYSNIVNILGIEHEETDDKDKRKEYNIKGLPTTILLDDSGNEVYSILGNVNEDKALESLRYYIDGRRD